MEQEFFTILSYARPSWHRLDRVQRWTRGHRRRTVSERSRTSKSHGEAGPSRLSRMGSRTHWRLTAGRWEWMRWLWSCNQQRPERWGLCQSRRWTNEWATGQSGVERRTWEWLGCDQRIACNSLACCLPVVAVLRTSSWRLACSQLTAIISRRLAKSCAIRIGNPIESCKRLSVIKFSE